MWCKLTHGVCVCVLRLRILQVSLHLSPSRMGENEQQILMPVSSPHTSWLKKCLQKHSVPRSDVQHGVHTDHRSFCSRKLLIITFLTMLILAVMVLLLFWNYQCIFVWHWCHEEDTEVDSTSAFRGM